MELLVDDDPHRRLMTAHHRQDQFMPLLEPAFPDGDLLRPAWQARRFRLSLSGPDQSGRDQNEASHHGTLVVAVESGSVFRISPQVNQAGFPRIHFSNQSNSTVALVSWFRGSGIPWVVPG